MTSTVSPGVLWFAFVSQLLKSHLSAEHVFFADLANTTVPAYELPDSLAVYPLVI
jgi:hypothetical protein